MTESAMVMASTTIHRPSRSLRVRLLWLTLVGMALALSVTGVALTLLFKQHVVSQFQAALGRQLDQLIVELEFDANGQPLVDTHAMLDPRLLKPYSGLYWQIDVLPDDGSVQTGVLRSRSLWDADLLAAGTLFAQPGLRVAGETIGPAKESLLVLQQIVSSPDFLDRNFRIIVAGDLRHNLDATERFGQTLAIALILLFILLALAALAQVGIGLRPLRDLQQALKRVRDGQAEQLIGHFPQEVQPLVDDFNQVLHANAAVVQRARTQAGNLAHALKTPLAILENEADHALACRSVIPLEMVKEQLAQIRRHVDWHLQRARAAATRGLPRQQTDAGQCVTGLLRVLERVHAERVITAELVMNGGPLLFAGEQQDLQEMLGNLLDNAFKWACSRVQVTLTADSEAHQLLIKIEDDGPGIDPAMLDFVRQRGMRLDENTPGSGLGLAIVQELVQHYQGRLKLENRKDAAGLSVTVQLPSHP